MPFAACTGLRIGELAALRVVDLNLAARKVRVRATAVGVSKHVSGGDKRQQEHLPKTAAGERTVPTITDEVADRMAQPVAERGLGLRDLLFTGRQGGPMMPDNWRRRIWDTAVERATAIDPQPTPHSLRHTADALWIGAALGGTRRQFIYRRVYGHLWKRDHADTCATITELLSGGSVRPMRMAN